MGHKRADDFNYSGLEFIFEPIARWIRNYREACGITDALAQCGAHEVARMARELTISPAELFSFVRKGPKAAELLPRLLVALGVDPKKLALENAAIMRDLQRLCIACGYKRACQHRLEQGTAAENFPEFCPNAYTLEALFKSKSDLHFWRADDKEKKSNSNKLGADRR